MKRIILAVLLALIFAVAASAQSTTVSLSVTDAPDSQTWNNGTYQTFFIGAQTPNWPGGSITMIGTVTSLSATGTASFSLPDNNTILPSGTQWRIQVCSATLPVRCFSQTQTVTASAQTIALTPPSPRFSVPTTPQVITPISAYADSEISGGWIGFTYSNVSATATPRICTAVSSATCTAWAAAGGGGGVTNVTVNPPTCTTGQSFFNTTTGNYLQCVATNTLSAVGDFIGTGPGTTPTAVSTGMIPSVIQAAGSGSNGTTVPTIQNTSQGNTLIVVGRCTGSCTINLPSDTQGNTFTTIQNSCTVGTNPWAIFQAVNIVGGADTVTFNTSGGTVNFGFIETTPATLDAVSACATATSATPTTNSVTTTVASELLLMLGQDQGSFNFTTIPPLQIIDPVTNSEFSAWEQVYTTGTYTATGTLTSSAWGASLVALKGNPPTLLGGSPTLNPGTQTALCTITTGNQACQFAIRASSQTFPAGQITVNVTGGITSIWPIASGAWCGNNSPNPCAGFSSSVPQFVLLASTDQGTSWEMVPGLSKSSIGASPSQGSSILFSGQYNITGLSGAWFRFMVTDGFGISNLVVTVSLG